MNSGEEESRAECRGRTLAECPEWKRLACERHGGRKRVGGNNVEVQS
jgi:hypothetical protein